MTGKIHHHTLTNEKLKKRFDNSFELVNYAISLAQNYVDTDRRPYIEIDKDNPALIILAEILEGADHPEDLVAPSQVDKEAKEAIAKVGLEMVKGSLKKDS